MYNLFYWATNSGGQYGTMLAPGGYQRSSSPGSRGASPKNPGTILMSRTPSPMQRGGSAAAGRTLGDGLVGRH